VRRASSTASLHNRASRLVQRRRTPIRSLSSAASASLPPPGPPAARNAATIASIARTVRPRIASRQAPSVSDVAKPTTSLAAVVSERAVADSLVRAPSGERGRQLAQNGPGGRQRGAERAQPVVRVTRAQEDLLRTVRGPLRPRRSQGRRRARGESGRCRAGRRYRIRLPADPPRRKRARTHRGISRSCGASCSIVIDRCDGCGHIDSGREIDPAGRANTRRSCAASCPKRHGHPRACSAPGHACPRRNQRCGISLPFGSPPRWCAILITFRPLAQPMQIPGTGRVNGRSTWNASVGGADPRC
jgi:hypothetical protein